MTENGDGIARRLEELDGTLFAGIPSESTENDRRSLLACQLAARRLAPGYCYFEIGSHLGGSIQPHLLDAECAAIFSLDLRSARQPDERGPAYPYPQNSTQRMLDNLARLSSHGLAKVVCIDGDSRQVSPAVITRPPQLCFIDGEHTDQAVVADFLFASGVLAQNGAILFHDSYVIYNGLAEVVARLRQAQRPFHAYNLPDALFVVEIGDFPLHASPQIHALLLDNHVGYLDSLRANDHYRRFANRAPFRWLRWAWSWARTMRPRDGARKSSPPARPD